MWRRLGQFILKYRILLLVIVLALTAAMGYWASKMQISYDFSRAIPTDNPKYRAYEDFRKKFGEDGNLLVIGVQTAQIKYIAQPPTACFQLIKEPHPLPLKD